MSEHSVPERIAWAVQRMSLTPNSRVLEIGCGSGQALALLAERVPNGELVGIDRSARQIMLARERLAPLAPRKRPRVEPLTLVRAVEQWRERPFDQVLAINVNVFWTEAPTALAHLAALLTPAGSALLVFELPAQSGIEKVRKPILAGIRACGLAARTIEVTFARGAGIAFALSPDSGDP